MEALLEPVQDFLEGTIDFEGQKLAENISTYSLTIVGILSFLIGFALQNILVTLWLGLAGSFLTWIVVVPAWPFYNRHPVQWLDSQSQPAKAGTSKKITLPPGVEIMVDGKKVQ